MGTTFLKVVPIFMQVMKQYVKRQVKDYSFK